MADAEAAGLRRVLAGQRRHVLGILDGLPDDALRRPVLPSGWSCLGLVHHLAVGVERFWFRSVVAGERLDYPDDDWLVPAELSADEVFARYRDEAERADAILDRTPLDAPPAAWPDWWPDWRYADLSAVLLHVIAETATHAGHLDAVRELIDGRTWLVVG
ncbi:MAG TPA: DinB family protein [Jatrophihabitans sp.]|nr:DinB family protein [Jatrophihabitans sp.]